uniref:Reverse transcriptase domain-containing protein n=1 Tax=Acrobeloides nanus TaxID=290746 RepID=A0A914CQZ8_9BILA
MRFPSISAFKKFMNLGLDQTVWRKGQEYIATWNIITRKREQLKFLNHCKKQLLLPRFITGQTSHLMGRNKLWNDRIEKLQKSMLSHAIRKLMRELQECLQRTFRLYTALSNELPPQKIVEIRQLLSLLNAETRIETSVRLKNKAELLLKRKNNWNRSLISTTKPAKEQVIERNRMSVIGNISLSDTEVNILSLGPSFSPAVFLTRNTIHSIKRSLCTAGYSLHWKAQIGDSSTSSQGTDVLFTHIPFGASRITLPKKDPQTERALVSLSRDLDKILEKWAKIKISDNLTGPQRQGLKSIMSRSRSKEIRVSISDKGGDFVVLPTQLDIAITELHLLDQGVYEKTNEKAFLCLEKSINENWVKIASSCGLPKRLISLLATRHSTPPCLYTLIKTHKLAPEDLKSNDPAIYKVRPIISSCGGPADKVSWFLSVLLSPLLKFVPAHLRNTAHFLEKLGNTDVDRSLTEVRPLPQALTMGSQPTGPVVATPSISVVPPSGEGQDANGGPLRFNAATGRRDQTRGQNPIEKGVPDQPREGSLNIDEVNSLIASFDVVSLYTNVDNESSIEAVLSLASENWDAINSFGLSLRDIKDLLKSCLSANIFTFNEIYYRQKRGLAMGNRIAPILAIAFMHSLESRALFCNPKVYVRYIDDTFIVADSEEALQSLFANLNSQNENIKFTMERSNEQGWLAFLDTEVRVSGERFETR